MPQNQEMCYDSKLKKGQLPH